MFQAETKIVPAQHAFDRLVDALRDLRKAGWIVLETREAGKGDHGHARRCYSAAKAGIAPAGREALELIG